MFTSTCNTSMTSTLTSTNSMGCTIIISTTGCSMHSTTYISTTRTIGVSTASTINISTVRVVLGGEKLINLKFW